MLMKCRRHLRKIVAALTMLLVWAVSHGVLGAQSGSGYTFVDVTARPVPAPYAFFYA